MTELSATAFTRPLRQKSFALFLMKAQRMAKRGMTAMIIHWERRAARIALQRLDDRALMDIGVPRSAIDHTVDHNARSHMRRMLRS